MFWSTAHLLVSAARLTHPNGSDPLDFDDEGHSSPLALEDGPRAVPGQSSMSSFNSTRKQQRQREQSRSRSRHSAVVRPESHSSRRHPWQGGAVRPELPKRPLRDTGPSPKRDQDKGARKLSPKWQSRSNQKTPTPTKRPISKHNESDYTYETYTTSSSEEPHRQGDWSHRHSVCSWHDRGNSKEPAVHTSDMTKADTEAKLGVSPSGEDG